MNVFIVIYFLVLEISVQWLSVSSYRVLLKPVKTSTKYSPFKEQFTSGINTDDSPSNSIAFVPGPPYEESSETSETFPFRPLLQTGFQPTRDYDSFHLSSPTLPQILPSLKFKSQRENYTENLFTTGSNKLNFVSEENGGIHRKKSALNSDSQKPKEPPVLTPFKSEYQLPSNTMFSNADILQKLIKSPNYKVYAKPITNKQVHTWNEHESGGRNGLLGVKESKKSLISPVESLETLLKYNGNSYWVKSMKGTKTSHETNRNVPQSLFSAVTENVLPNPIQSPNYNKDGFVDLSKVRTMTGSRKQQQINNEKLANPHEYSPETFLHMIENNNKFFSNNDNDSGGNNGKPVIKSFLERSQSRKLNSTKSEIFRPVEKGNIAAAESFVRSQATKAYTMTNSAQIKKPNKKKSREMRMYKKTKGFITSEKPKFLLQQQQQQQLYNIPAIRYINSLTMAHFADPNSSPPRSELQEFMRALRQPLNLTQVLNYLRANKTNVNGYSASRMSGDLRGQKPREFLGQNHPIHLSSRTKSDSAAASTQQYSNSLNSAPETEPKVISLDRFGGKNGEENIAGEDRIPSIDSRIPKANKYDSINVWTQSNRKFQSFENALFEASLIDDSNKVDIKRSTEEKENGHQKNFQTSKGTIRNRYRRETLLIDDKELPHGSDDVAGDKNEIRSEDEEVLEKISVEVETLKSQETKRPLTRLSGLDFLTRYYKTKSKPNQHVDDFWKVTTTNSKVSSSISPITSAGSIKPNESTKAIKDTLEEVNKQRPLNRNLPEKTTTRAPPRYSRKLRILVTAPPPLKNRNLQPKTKEVNQTRSIPTNSSNVPKGVKTEIKPIPEKTIKKLFTQEVTTSKQNLPKLESSTKISLVTEKLFTTRPTKADEEKSSTKPFTIKVPKYTSIIRDPVSHGTAEEGSTTAPFRIESKTLPFTEAFETDKKFLREKPTENIHFRPEPQQSDFVVGTQETWKDKYLPEVSTLRSNFQELGLKPRPIPQIQSTKVVEGGNEETGTHKPKTIQYETITRNPVTWRAEDVPEVSSPRYNFQEYITPPTVSIIPKETFLESKELREYKDYEVEGLRPKTLQYTTIDRNREAWKNEEPQQVSSQRPSYREFEPSIKIIEIGGGSKPTTGRQPEIVPFSPLLTPFDSINQNGEPWKNEYSPEVSTLRSTIQIIVEPLKPKPVANGNSTDDKAKPNQALGTPAPQETPEPSEAYEDGPVLYYIVNEKTGRGRWISYPSDKHKHKFKIPKSEEIPSRQKQKHKTKKIIKKP